METRVIPVVHENYPSGHLLKTNWCLVTFVLVEAGFAVNWSITRKQGAMRIKWGTILKISTKKPKHYPHQKPASRRCGSDQHWYKKDLSWQSRLLEREAKRLLTIAFFSRTWFSLSTPVEIFSWPNLTGLSSLHLDIKTLLKHECIWTEELNYVWRKSTLKDIHEAAFPGSSLRHLIFRGRPTNFKFRSKRFSEICPGTLRTTSRLSRWIIHWNPTTSWCHL